MSAFLGQWLHILQAVVSSFIYLRPRTSRRMPAVSIKLEALAWR